MKALWEYDMDAIMFVVTIVVFGGVIGGAFIYYNHQKQLTDETITGVVTGFTITDDKYGTNYHMNLDNNKTYQINRELYDTIQIGDTVELTKDNSGWWVVTNIFSCKNIDQS